MIETSPRLTEVQKATLGARAERIAWHQTIAELPEQPLIIVGNELFDAIPIRQYVKIAGRWRERAIGLDDAGELAFHGGCRQRPIRHCCHRMPPSRPRARSSSWRRRARR